MAGGVGVGCFLSPSTHRSKAATLSVPLMAEKMDTHTHVHLRFLPPLDVPNFGRQILGSGSPEKLTPGHF